MNIQEVYKKLVEKIPEKNIKQMEQMNKHTTFKIGGPAELFIKVKNIEHIKYILEISNLNNIPFFVLGNGSNILVKDEGIKGIIIKPEFDKIEIETKEDKVLVKVGSGVTLPKLAQILAKEGIAGLEFASGIPGTIGGAVKLNAGAFKKEMNDVVMSTTYMDKEGNVQTINNKEHKFSYRRSIFFEKDVVILETTLILEYGNEENIKNLMKEFMNIRLEKQPYNLPNAGSIFKRGENYITAKLIDDAGLKGYKVGGAEISTLHAGFIVNDGTATANDIIQVIEHIKKEIKKIHDIDLKLEIEIIE